MTTTVLADTRDALPVQAEVPRMHERPRFSAALDLVALPTAVTVARLFIADTMRRWGAMFIEPDMEPIAAELVTLAVEATGPAAGTSWNDIQKIGAIKVCLVGWRKHIVVEVSDEHDEELVLLDDADLPDDSGLGLIDARAGRWGSCRIPSGRVMWAEVPVYKRTAVGLPQRTPKPAPIPRSTPDASRHGGQYADLLRSVRDGLERM